MNKPIPSGPHAISDAYKEGYLDGLERAAGECDQVAKQAAKFSLGPQQDCASELARNIRELKSETPQ